MPDAVGVTHHVELGGHFYMVRPGSYVKKPAPQFGARFTTGDPDYNNLSFWQHWAQGCFIGGVDQDDFADDAMYDDGIGIDTTEHEHVQLARELLPGGGANWGLDAGTAAAAGGWKAFVFNSKLYVVTIPSAGTESKLWEYSAATDAWTNITSLGAKNICVRSVAGFDGKIFLGGVDSVTGYQKIVYDDGALTSWTALTKPAALSNAAGNCVNAMAVFAKKLYVAYGYKIWRLKNDQTWDGNVEFYRVNDHGANAIVSMTTHLGFLYMLSSNGHVLRTDGNASFDIWNWDGQTQGRCIKSFDGRLFIMTYEFTETSNVGWGVLYQMSGSAMTQLKRWGDATNATLISSMSVYDRRLWYGASNGLGFAGSTRPVFGVVAYDPIEDAHCIVATNSNTTAYARGSTPYTSWIVDEQIFFGGYLFVFVRGHGGFKTPYQNRDRQRGIRRYDTSAASTTLDSTNGGWFTTSTYDAGTPGVLKMWRKITIDCETPTSTGMVVDYSLDNGASWTKAGTVSEGGARKRYEFFLQNKISTALKLRFTLRSTNNTVSPVFYGFGVSYIPQPEPNWMWSFTIVLSDSQVLLDGTIDTVSTEAEIAFLEGLYRNKELVTYTEADGTRWESTGSPGVLVYDLVTNLRDLNQPLEGEVTITLLEAVETY